MFFLPILASEHLIFLNNIRMSLFFQGQNSIIVYIYISFTSRFVCSWNLHMCSMPENFSFDTKRCGTLQNPTFSSGKSNSNRLAFAHGGFLHHGGYPPHLFFGRIFHELKHQFFGGANHLWKAPTWEKHMNRHQKNDGLPHFSHDSWHFYGCTECS